MDLRQILNIKYPIIQGAMARIATGEFAAVVSRAGGLGLIASGGLTADQVREQIHILRGLTDKPFGVNLMLMQDCDDIAELVIEEGVKIVTTGAGNPAKYMEKWKDAGIKVFPIIPGVALARRMEQYGADGVIVEGTEAGGHVGEATTMALVPQVVDAVKIPVVVAGGIADRRQMLAAYALGACGVQVGTVLLASVECPIHDNYKQAVLTARDNSTVVTGRSGGAPVRILRNQMSNEYIKLENSGATRDELEQLTLGGLSRAVYQGDTARGSLMAGQVAGMLREIKPVAMILEELFSGCREAYEKLGAHPVFGGET